MKFNFKYYYLFIFLTPVFITGCSGEKLKWLDDKAGTVLDNIPRVEESLVVDEEKTGEATSSAEATSTTPAGDLAEEMKIKIDAWLEKNKLNHFGDPIETMYTGGTPLFNEITGETKDRFEYILEKIPDLLEKLGD